VRTSGQRGFDDFLKALGKDFSLVCEISSQTALLGKDFVPGNKERDQGNPDHQRKN
jgi:hypothetical protein